MRKEDEFKDIIREVGYEPFFVHYTNGKQIHMYRKYCSQVNYPEIIIDATGSVVKKFSKLGLDKTNTIFLYQAIVYDELKRHSFTITNMLSERHNTICISNWLAYWMSCNVPKPKKVACDQSLALLSSIVRTFTQYSSLNSYIHACADIITNKIPKDSRWLRQCYVKLDVAHFMKLASQWPDLKLLNRRVREIILRTIGTLIKCEDLEDVYSLFLSLLITISNETNGVIRNTDIETSCQKHYMRLINTASTGTIELDQQLDTIIDYVDTENTCLDGHDNDDQLESLNDVNPFQALAETVFNESKRHVQEGVSINPLYAPKIVPHLIKMMKFLPLWSGIMVPFFGYGERVSSSAAVESSFHKLKNVTLKHVSLPTDIDFF